MKPEPVTKLPPNTPTERLWNFRDDNNEQFFGTIPLNQEVITMTLNWKTDAEAPAKEVGRYKINLPGLEVAGHVRKTDRGYILRFQRTGSRIEIAINKGSPAYPVGQQP